MQVSCILFDSLSTDQVVPLILGVQEAERDLNCHFITLGLEKLLVKVAYSSAKLNLQYQ